MTPEEWAPCAKLFGPHVVSDEARARIIVNTELNAPGLDLIREFDVLDRLGEIPCPTLICVGELDPVTPVAAAREMADALPDSTTEVVVFEGAGHFTWLDVPDRYWPLLEEFVAAQTAGSDAAVSGR